MWHCHSMKYIATKPLHHTPHCTNPANNSLNPSCKLLSLDNSKAPSKQLTTSLLSVTQGSMNSRHAKYCFTAAFIFSSSVSQVDCNWSCDCCAHIHIIPSCIQLSLQLPALCPNLSHCALSPHIYIYLNGMYQADSTQVHWVNIIFITGLS